MTVSCEVCWRTIRSHLHARALEALAIVLQTVNPVSQERIAARERHQLMQARRMLDERYGEDWTITKLARAIGLGEKKLQASFRVIAGRSIHVHLREVRLEAADAMLVGSTSVTDAAYAVGFSGLIAISAKLSGMSWVRCPAIG